MTISSTTQTQLTESKIIHCEFTNCKNFLNNGGAVWIECNDTNHKLDLDYDTFENNSVIAAGCALYLNAATVNIQHCRFINNNCLNRVADGVDIYFIFDVPKKPVVSIRHNEFIRSLSDPENHDKARSIFYFKELQAVVFFLMDNSFILTDNFNEVADAAIFYSEQPGYDYTSWVFQDNCLLQSDYPLGVKNEYFTPPDTRWETAFADKCSTYIPTPEQTPESTPEQTPDPTITQTPESTPEQTPDPTCNLPDYIFHDGNCNLNLRCHYTAREGDQIWVSEFNGYSRSDEDGGAIHVVDSGLQCNQTNFTSCM